MLPSTISMGAIRRIDKQIIKNHLSKVQASSMDRNMRAQNNQRAHNSNTNRWLKLIIIWIKICCRWSPRKRNTIKKGTSFNQSATFKICLNWKILIQTICLYQICKVIQRRKSKMKMMLLTLKKILQSNKDQPNYQIRSNIPATKFEGLCTRAQVLESQIKWQQVVANLVATRRLKIIQQSEGSLSILIWVCLLAWVQLYSRTREEIFLEASSQVACLEVAIINKNQRPINRYLMNKIRVSVIEAIKLVALPAPGFHLLKAMPCKRISNRFSRKSA